MSGRPWATRHICASKNIVVSCIPVEDGEELVYLGDFRTTLVLGMGKVMLKFTSDYNFFSSIWVFESVLKSSDEGLFFIALGLLVLDQLV
ncbi:hypothetical protein CR513_34455, partial [Mucuna pruriens]